MVDFGSSMRVFFMSSRMASTCGLPRVKTSENIKGESYPSKSAQNQQSCFGGLWRMSQVFGWKFEDKFFPRSKSIVKLNDEDLLVVIKWHTHTRVDLITLLNLITQNWRSYLVQGHETRSAGICAFFPKEGDLLLLFITYLLQSCPDQTPQYIDSCHPQEFDTRKVLYP